MINFNKLYGFPIAIMVLATGATGGCATATPERDDHQVVEVASAAVSKGTVPTQFATDADPDEGDFWGTGTTVTVDEDGRLVYATQIALVEGRDINATFDVNRPNAYDPNTVYIDPRTGRQIILNRSGWRRVPQSVILPPAQTQMPTEPMISPPRPATSRMDRPRPRRSVRDGLRRDR